MSPQEFREVCEKLTEHSLDVMMQKQTEYSKDSDDVLVAFKKAGDLQGLSSRQALAGMMAKHTVSVYDMLMDPDLPDEAHAFEKLGDHINYLYLAWAMLWEERNHLVDEMVEASEGKWNGPTGAEDKVDRKTHRMLVRPGPFNPILSREVCDTLPDVGCVCQILVKLAWEKLCAVGDDSDDLNELRIKLQMTEDSFREALQEVAHDLA